MGCSAPENTLQLQGPKATHQLRETPLRSFGINPRSSLTCTEISLSTGVPNELAYLVGPDWSRCTQMPGRTPPPPEPHVPLLAQGPAGQPGETEAVVRSRGPLLIAAALEPTAPHKALVNKDRLKSRAGFQGGRISKTGASRRRRRAAATRTLTARTGDLCLRNHQFRWLGTRSKVLRTVAS